MLAIFLSCQRDADCAVGISLVSILLDVKSPDVQFAASLDVSEPFNTDQPEFTGTIADPDSGVDWNTVFASIDDGPDQNVTVDATNGTFVFKTKAHLTGGMHSLVIKAKDLTGNQGQSIQIRFKVVVPLAISQVVQYPNPARRRMF